MLSQVKLVFRAHVNVPRLEAHADKLMKWIWSRDELLMANNSPSELARLIEESSGYALVLMLKEGFRPSLDSLMAVASPHSLSFMLDHYELGASERKALAVYFKRATGNAKLAGINPTPEQQHQAFVNGEPLMEGATLSWPQLRDFPEKVQAQFDHDHHEAERMLKRSIQALSHEHFLQLDRALLEEHAHLFGSNPGLYMGTQGARAKALCRELIESRAARSKRELSLRDFDEWPFGREDLNFLWALLDSEARRRSNKVRWSTIEQMNGAKELIDPLEFFLKINPLDVTLFSLDRAKELKPVIQKAWLAEIAHETYGALSKLLRIESSPEMFELLVDKDFVKRLTQATQDRRAFHLDGMHRDDAETRAKVIHLKTMQLEAAIDDPCGALTKASPSDWASLMEHLVENPSIDTQDIPPLIDRGIAALVPTLLRHQAGLMLDMSRHATRWFSPGLLSSFKTWAESNPSINALWMVGKAWAELKHKKSWQDMDLANTVKSIAMDMSRTLEPRKANLILSSVGLPTLGIAARAKRAVTRMKEGAQTRMDSMASNSDFDFLSFDYDRFSELLPSIQKMIVDTDPACASELEKRKILPNEELLLHVLNQGPERFTVLSKLVAIDETSAMSFVGFSRLLREHKDAAMVLDLSAWPTQASWADVDAALAHALETSRAWKLSKSISHNMNATQVSPDEDEDEDEEHEPSPEQRCSDALEQEYRRLSDQAFTRLEQAIRSLDHASARNGIDSMLDHGRFEEYGHLIAVRLPGALEAKSRLFRHIESMGMDELSKKLNDPASAPFLKSIIIDSVDYSGESNLSIDWGSPRDNLAFARQTAPWFLDKPLNVLSIFDPKAASNFANEFAMEWCPAMVPYSYKLSPTKRAHEAFRGYVVNRPYSNQDVLDLWDKLEAGPGFFSEMDVNASFKNFFHANYKGDKQRYLQALDMAKSRPMLYCVLCSNNLGEDFEQEDRKARALANNNSDRRTSTMAFAMRYFDWEVIIQGVKEICELMERRSGDELFNSKLAACVVESVIWSSFAQVPDGKGGELHRSELGEEASAKLLETLCKKAPLIAYGTRALGCFSDVSEAICSRGDQMFGQSAMERFVFPPYAHKPQYYDLNHGYKHSAEKILIGLFQWMGHKGVSADLQFVDWWLKESSFRQQELAWDWQGSLGAPGSTAPYMQISEFLSTNEPVTRVLSVEIERLSLHEAIGDNQARKRKANRL